MRQPNGRVPQGTRKVRAPQGRVPANGWWRRLQGECNREIPPGFPARVERCGKSAPAAWQLVRYVNPTRCKIEGGAWGGPLRSRYRISSLATGCVDRWPFTTELGLQAALIYIGKPAFGPVFSYITNGARNGFSTRRLCFRCFMPASIAGFLPQRYGKRGQPRWCRPAMLTGFPAYRRPAPA